MQLTPDDALFLQTIYHYFHEQAAWPTLRWLEREFINYDFDILELEYRLLGLMYNLPNYPHVAFDPERQMKLPPLALARFCVETESELESRAERGSVILESDLELRFYYETKDDLDAFVSVVRLCFQKYYDQVEPLTMTQKRYVTPWACQRSWHGKYLYL